MHRSPHTQGNKHEPDESRCVLARRVNRVWQAQNRDRLRPREQAPVLPLRCRTAMHAAAGEPLCSAPGVARERSAGLGWRRLSGASDGER